jgi:hypothetical protein
MSLDVLAQHLASRGRGGDTMLVHMTPGEVHGLHALALAHGGQLTINPETGLPEANFLKKILPMVAGAALNFFLPGVGTAIGSALGGLSGAAGSAIAVGGITGLATGSLQKGLMAGLGAYGGAGLTDALLGGAGAAGAAGALGVEGAASGAGSQAAMLAEQAAGFGGEGLKSLAESAAYAKGATPSLSAAFSAGADAAMKNPGAFLKGAAKPLMYAAAPVLADAMVPTTTGMPESRPGDTGYIRPFVYDPATFGQGPQGLQALAPVAANTIKYPPPGGAAGGIVALAGGGTAKPASVGDLIYRGDKARQNQYGFDQEAFELTNFLNPVRDTYMSDSDWQSIYSADDPIAALRSTVQQAASDPRYYQQLQQTGLFPGAANFDAIAADRARMYGGRYDPSMLGAAPAAVAAEPVAAEPVAAEPVAAALAPVATSAPTPFEMAQKIGRTLPSTWGAAGGAYDEAAEKITYFNQNKYTVDDLLRAGVPREDIGWMLQHGFKPTVAAPAPTPAPKPPVPTPAPTPAPAPVTVPIPGTTTGTVNTQDALNTYNLTAPTGTPPAVTSVGTLEGYEGEDKTYGGVTPLTELKKIELAKLGTAGKVTPGNLTMADVRRQVGDRYAAPTFDTRTSVTGASKSAYDYLMGQGAYPVNQTLPGGAPLWKPYVQAVGAVPSDAFVPIRLPSTTGTSGTTGAQFGFKAPTGGTTLTGTQRWKNTKTGEIYLAPSGYAPPSEDWVLDVQSNPDLDGAGVGTGTSTGNDGGGFGGTGEGFGEAKAGGLMQLAMGGAAGSQYNLGGYSDGGRLLRGPGDGVSDSIPATIGGRQPARLADGEFVIPARIVSELGNGSTEAGARKLYAMMDRVQRARRKTTGKNKVAANTKAERLLPA